MERQRCSGSSSAVIGGSTAILQRCGQPSDSFLFSLISSQPLDRLIPWLPSLSLNLPMPRKRATSSGWAAFDLKQRQKQGLEPDTDQDPFPPFPSTIIPLNCESTARNNGLSTKPFASVLLPSGQKFMETRNSDSPRKHGNEVVEGNSHELTLKHAKLLHSWADDTLIADVLAAVGNDFEKASTLLKGMMSSSSSDENDKQTTIADVSYMTDNFTIDDKNTDDSSLSDYNSTKEDNVEENHRESANLLVSCGTKLSNNVADAKSIQDLLSSLPVEPEWEEDDVYMIHRKDALKMMRSASQHSRAANNAFIRGDHFSAHQLSLKAREERLIAEKLNSKAAKKILSIRNSENDVWKLDLHGLHAAEAVQAFQERLQQIEMQPPMNRSLSPNRGMAKSRMVHSSSNESLSRMNREDVDKQLASHRQIRKPLEVITGVGNHSRGQAALPAAVRSFLSENRYRFEETRPGVITVRPKFRHR